MKIDLHCHSFYSKDALSSPEKLLKTALKKGLDGIAITDHNTTKAWPEAKNLAEKMGLKIVFGEEIKTKRNGKVVGDILGLFLKEEIKSRELFQVIKEIKLQGGIVIVPHPFHFPEHFKENLEKILPLIDGLEVFNARMPFPFFDKKAFAFAQKHNLAITAGSDAHFHSEVGNAYTIVERAKNLEEFKEGILKKETKIKGKRSLPFSLIFPLLAKIKNFRL